MDKYTCNICGYVYEPENGDPDNSVDAGTPFDKIPEGWECQICGASTDDFDKE